VELPSLRIHLHEGEGVLRKAPAGRQKERLVLRKRLDQRFVCLQCEWNRVPDQLRVVVPREDIPTLGERVGHALHGHRLERAAGKHEQRAECQAETGRAESHRHLLSAATGAGRRTMTSSYGRRIP
jgi:hypothetical protein